MNSSSGLFALRPGHFDTGTRIFAQFIAQTAKGDVESPCCMSSIPAAVSERANDMCSYRLGESGVIVYDRHDLTFILAPSCQPVNIFATPAKARLVDGPTTRRTDCRPQGCP